MKTMKGARLSALLLSGMLMAALPLNAMATEQEVILEDTGSTLQNPGTNIYTGQADNGIPQGTIEVQAKSNGNSEIIYHIQIKSGPMQFEYSYGSSWNPLKHIYEGSDTAGWALGYVDGTNNKIEIANNSNFPVEVVLKYNDDGEAFNQNKTASGAVTGIFNRSNPKLKDATILKKGYGQFGQPDFDAGFRERTFDTIKLEMDASLLEPGKEFYATAGQETAASNGTAYTDIVYFALSGTPDPGFSSTFVKVGTITVDITPAQQAARHFK